MKKVILILIAVLVITAVSINADAFRGHGGMGPGPGYGYGLNDRMIAYLHLTADQVERIRALREANLKDIQPLLDELNSKRGELRHLWLERTPDQAKIAAMNREIRTLRDQVEEKITHHRLAISRVLTPEQQAKFQRYGPDRGYGMDKGLKARGNWDTDFGKGRGMGMRGD